jgi:energy-coupling factor transporter ATP-binding protein EcfA2
VESVVDFIKENGSAMILVEHNTERAIQLSNRTFRLIEGELVEQFSQGGEEE